MKNYSSVMLILISLLFLLIILSGFNYDKVHDDFFYKKEIINNIKIDGEYKDWIDSGLILYDEIDDVKKMNKSKDSGKVEKIDDIASYGFAMDDENIYCMFEPRKMPGKDDEYLYRIALLKKDDGWKTLYAAEWRNNQNYVYKYNMNTKKASKIESSEIIFKRKKAFEVKIPRKFLSNLQGDFYPEAELWHGHKNLIDTALKKSFSTLKISYLCELKKPKDNYVKVRALFSNPEKGPFNLNININKNSTQKVIKDFRAFTKDGKKLNIGISEKEVSVENPDGNDFFIEYKVMNNIFETERAKGFYNYITDTYFLGNARWTFFEPAEKKAAVYRLKIVSPNKWKILTPYQKKGDYYFETDNRLFYPAAFGAGIFDVREKMITGTRSRMAVDTTFDKKRRDEIFENCFGIFKYTKSHFTEESVPEAHLTIFGKSEKEGQWQHGNESCYSHGEIIYNKKWTYDSHSHRIFHTYNAFYPKAMSISSSWFVEGPNIYNSIIIFMKTKTEVPFESLKKRYEDKYLKEADKYNSSLNGNTRDKNNWGREAFLTYTKGTIVTFLLDREIRKATNGGKNLYDVVYILYTRFSNKKYDVIDDEIIKNVCNEVSKKDFTSFFEKYIYSKSKINIDYLFTDDDNDRLYYAVEEWLGTDPKNADTDNDGVNDYEEYLNDTIFVR